MTRAIALARLHFGQTGENPSVGCVIVRDGKIIGEAVTGIGGRPHAEETALENLGGKAEGATAYVTLEPCRERSTGAPSCSMRLIEAGVSRVVYAADDPHPTASGGVDRMVSAGIRVDHLPMPDETEALYGAFFRAHGG